MAGQLTLVLGGIRSGKSAFAEGLAEKLGLPTIYLATGQVTDDDMAQRIRQHQERRPPTWTTLEEPLQLAPALSAALKAATAPTAVMLDSVDTWVSNLLLKYETETTPNLTSRTIEQVDQLLEVLSRNSAPTVMVSSEVGQSLVATTQLGRRFQDLLGLANQRLAAAATRVYLVVAGIPITIKNGPVE